MTPEENYKKTDEVISKFRNGQDLFRKSPLFNRAVQMLVRDVDPYELIAHLIQVTEDTQKALENQILRRNI